jgi:hypothetical protein
VIGLDVTLAADALRAVVAEAIIRTLSSGWLDGGAPALFNPERLGFATTVYASPVLAAVHGIDGVHSATLTRFGFLHEQGPTAVPDSLTVGALEIPRLDSDPTHPEHGYVLLSLQGGR